MLYEVITICGAIVAYGRRYGVPTPVNGALGALEGEAVDEDFLTAARRAARAAAESRSARGGSGLLAPGTGPGAGA